MTAQLQPIVSKFVPVFKLKGVPIPTGTMATWVCIILIINFIIQLALHGYIPPSFDCIG